MPTLVILPGWGQSSKDWTTEVTTFSGVNTVFIDPPGFGETPLVNDNWGIPEYALFVSTRIESLREKNVILLGHSFGGRIAAYIAAQNPPWLNALVLYGAPCLYRPTTKTMLLSKIATIAKKLGFSSKLSRNAELREADERGLGKIFRKAIPFDQTALLPKIKVRTLLLWGKNDQEAPLYIAEEIHNLIPQSDLEIIDNAGHNVHITNQYIFYGKLNAYLQNL